MGIAYTATGAPHTDKIDLRELNLGTLLEITKEGAYSHIAIKNTLDKYQYLDKQQRSFITRVCEGTLEHMILIDYIINQFSKVKANKMKPVIRTIIRSAVYELKYMDSVPDSATCNEAVKLAQKKGFHNLKGFVNGVLRTISRNLDQVKLPDKEKEPIRYLSIAYSMPEWILNIWLNTYTLDKTEKILQSFFVKGPLSIRVNTKKTTKEELKSRLCADQIKVTESEWLPYALYIEDFDSLQRIQAFAEGQFYVQDITSMLVAEWAQIKENDFVIDVCAAPGGKSMHIAELLQGTGMVEARDLTPHKVAIIKENIERVGLANIKVRQIDARVLQAGGASADVVIADLPCSGLGVMGKKTDIKYKMTEQKQQELIKFQREILHTVKNYVKQGGVLMYSTCTINPNENEYNIDWFLKEHPTFKLDWQKQLLPDGQGKMDGFFIARLLNQG
ncbi:16S rRNA (cytosine(967)-C(5))-methyltransferase RsmB [Lachnospiraceae bacterium ZAX-1]